MPPRRRAPARAPPTARCPLRNRRSRSSGGPPITPVAGCGPLGMHHPRRPFEDGTPPPPTAIAARSARPSALNVASATWCRLRPRIRSTWIVAPRWIDSARQNSSITSDSSVPIRPRSGTLYERNGRLPRSTTTRASDSSSGAYAAANLAMPARSPSAFDSAWPTTMPASSTRWCVSTCTSPCPTRFRSKPPYCASCSIMWSRNGSRVETLIRPRPSSSTFAVSCVSLLLRETAAVLLKPHLDGVRVRAQPLHLRQPDARLAQELEVAAVEAQHAGALQERVHAERRGESRGARGRQGVVGAGRVVAERHRREGAHENRPRVLDLRGQAPRVRRDDQQVLRREVVGELDRLSQVVGDDDAARRLADDLRPFEPTHEVLDRKSTRLNSSHM